MINWSLYKGRDNERGKKAYIGFCELLKNGGYKLISEYINNSTKVELECDKQHRYFASPNNFKSGYRCPMCPSKKSEIAKLDFIKQVKKEGYKLIGNYVDNSSKIELECDKQHRYFVMPHNFKKGRRCPVCYEQRLETTKLEFIKQVEKEGYKLLGKYKKANTKVELECDKQHRYFVQPNSFKQGQRCPICSGQHPETAKLDFIKRVENEGYKVLGEYVNNHTKVKLECNKQHRYFVQPDHFKRGNRCPVCETVSHGEILTKKILDEYNCKYEYQKKFDGLVGLNNGQLSFDFFVDDYLLIEIQGEQHYKPIKYFGGEEQFKKQQEHDRKKREFAKKNGYELLEIPYLGVKDLGKIKHALIKELSINI